MIIKRTEIHTFVKGEKKCKVTSQRKGNNFIVTFCGWNPFPCYSMETSWSTFKKWMNENGWIEKDCIIMIIHKEV